MWIFSTSFPQEIKPLIIELNVQIELPSINNLPGHSTRKSESRFPATPTNQPLYSSYLLTHSTQHSPSWEANQFAASQEIPRILWNPKFITAFTSASQLSLSWASTIQSIHEHPVFWSSIFLLSYHLSLGLPSCLFPSVFNTKILYTPLCSPTRVTCPTHLIFLDFITHAIVGEQYKSPFVAQRHIYISYRTANLQTLNFKYLFKKYPYWIF
jgi:hypothetical protein